LHTSSEVAVFKSAHNVLVENGKSVDKATSPLKEALEMGWAVNNSEGSSRKAWSQVNERFSRWSKLSSRIESNRVKVASFAGLPSMKVYLPSDFSQTKPLESKDYAKSRKTALTEGSRFWP
jgi:hypothetical protein